jgi:tetratricopeptide (TPR) repeat protein
MASTNRPVNLNNEGVNFLNVGLYDDAARSFKEALSLTRDMLVRQQECKLDGQPNQASRESYPVILDRDLWLSDTGIVGGCAFMVFQAPVKIQQSLDDIPLNRLSAMILFNFALSHHLKATSSEGCTSYEKIIQLYEHAYRLFSQETKCDSFILTLAIVNNLAHLHYKLRNEKDAERLCSALWGAVLLAERCAVDTSQLEGFFSNVIHVAFKHSQSAPAA